MTTRDIVEEFDLDGFDWERSTRPPPPDTPIEHAAAYYARHGHHVVPLIDKSPEEYGRDWWTRATDDPVEAIKVFAADSRYTNVGLCMGRGYVAVDIDHPDALTDEMRFVLESGAINRTRGDREHRVFRVDEEYGCSAARFPIKGFGEVRGCGGQIVGWGPHPHDPAAFYAFDPRHIPSAPAQLAVWLAPRRPYEVAATDEEVNDFVEAHVDATHPALLDKVTSKASRRVADGESIHYVTTSVACWALREVRCRFYPAGVALAVLSDWWAETWKTRAGHPASVDGEKLRAEPSRRELAGVVSWAVAQAMGESDENIAGRRRRTLDTRVEVLSPNGTAPVAEDQSPLPADFWQSRPWLRHIEQAARSRLVAPHAVLGASLARVAAIVGHTIETPAPVGTPTGLTTLVPIVGPPAASKSTSMNLAGELLPAPPNVIDRLPIGSGEGLVEVLYESVIEPDEDGKKRNVRRQTKHAVIVTIDEGSLLAETAERSGSTILSTLRIAWSHGKLGQANASADRRREVEGVSYVYGVTLAVQPELAAPLLAPAAIAAGTPQRLLWASADDPDAPDESPEWPGPLNWKPPTQATLEAHAIHRLGWLRHQLTIEPDITAEIRSFRLAVVRRTVQVKPLDAHRNLVRLKVAALVAILDRRLDINVDDWHLAGQIVDASDTIRDQTRAEIHQAADRDLKVRAEKKARFDITAGEGVAAAALQSAALSGTRVVFKHTDEGRHPEGSCANRCFDRAIGKRHREHVTAAEARARAVDNGWLVVDGSRLKPKPGRVAP